MTNFARQRQTSTQANRFSGTCLPDIVPEMAHKFPNARKFMWVSLEKLRCRRFHIWRTCNGNGALGNGGTEHVWPFNHDPDLSQK
jgi:hypothetical protein